MQVTLAKCEQFLRAVAPSGNLFLLLTLQELRKQGLTFIAFYALQRTIEYSGSSASALRQESKTKRDIVWREHQGPES